MYFINILLNLCNKYLYKLIRFCLNQNLLVNSNYFHDELLDINKFL